MSVRRWRLSARATNPVTVLSTGLNSLAATTGTAVSSTVSNDAADELDMFADFELFINGFATAPADNGVVEGYIVHTVDGTNFEQNNSEGRPRHGPEFFFIVDNVTTTQRLIAPMVLLPPLDFQVMIRNTTNQAFPSASNTLRALFYTTQDI